MQSRNTIHVAGADGELGASIARGLLEMKNLHPNLYNISIHAGIHHKTIKTSNMLTERNDVSIVEVDPINQSELVVDSLKKASKLLLLVDPLSGEVTRKDALAFAKGYINAAKEAGVEHIVFPTPFAKLIVPCSPPLTPTDETDKNGDMECISPYRDQFESIELLLRENFQPSQVTILRYPGVLNQHFLYFARYISEESKIPLIDNPHVIFECCDVSDVVRAICHILYSPVQRHGGKEYKITGPHLLTNNEISAKASLALGREIRTDFLPIKQLRQAFLDVTHDKEEVAYLLDLWGLQGQIGAARKVQVTRDLEMITGGTGMGLRKFFEKNRSTFSTDI
ncbi:11417_t:CDS:2 [Acaulospora morrowiae]|uniref:11417_t:CDS:1 n=1 Tax=Acaulospora morrowiae TaxID=94023 RepID=A0A9N9BTI5_9GLOM|nr:11417_t:CDS:2 [Acaulospora morrowiae]